MRRRAGGLALAACAVFVLLAPAGNCFAQAATSDPPRPRIALVLSGGGARGFAHVGVLRALHEMRVPVDMVAGVSMGAVVGGAFAAGRTVDELERFVLGTNWQSIVADRPPRDAIAFARREEDLALPSRLEFGVGARGLVLPPSTAGNAAIESALHRLLPVGSAVVPVHQLPLPFRTVASDLLSGELVELHDTPLFTSLRASLSVPGVFEPLRVEGRLVVDGGLVRNLPVDIARSMGADVVIAVNVGTPLAGEQALNSAFGVAQQMLRILTEQNVQRSLKELQRGDVLISPDLSGIGFLDFGRSEQAMTAGARAARAAAEPLRALALSPEAYTRHESSRRGPPASPDVALPLARLDVQPTQHAGRDALTALIGLSPGEPVTAAQVAEGATRLWNRGEFERVEVESSESPLGRLVRVVPIEAEWARSRVRVGVELVSDFEDDHRFSLSAIHILAWANEWGAELRTFARIGSQRLLSTSWMQPLAPGSPWFVNPGLQYEASSVDAYEQGRRTARIGYSLGTVSVAFGRELSNWGSVRLGVSRSTGRSEQLVPEGALPEGGRVAATTHYLQWGIDTLDSLALPSRGLLLQGRLARVASRMGDPRRSDSSVIGLFAFRAGTWDSHVYADWSRARTGSAPLPLGGFLRLSGTPRDSIESGRVLLGRLVMAQRIGDMPAGLGGAVRAGGSIELGGAFEQGDAVRWSGFKRAGSAFVVVDTRFGPLFLGAGATRGVGSSLYLFVGPFW